MAEYTSNYGLYKPNENDTDVEVGPSLTENFETIDAEIKNRADEIENLDTRQSEDKDSLEQSISNVDDDLQNYKQATDNTLTNLQNDVTGNSDSIGALQQDVSGNSNSIGTLQQNVSTNADNISTLQDNVDSLLQTNKGVFVTSGDDAATSVSIPHGLDAEPSYYQAQPGSADAAGISYITADETNITVHFDAALVSGTDNISIVWKAEN